MPVVPVQGRMSIGSGFRPPPGATLNCNNASGGLPDHIVALLLGRAEQLANRPGTLPQGRRQGFFRVVRIGRLLARGGLRRFPMCPRLERLRHLGATEDALVRGFAAQGTAKPLQRESKASALPRPALDPNTVNHARQLDALRGAGWMK